MGNVAPEGSQASGSVICCWLFGLVLLLVPPPLSSHNPVTPPLNRSVNSSEPKHNATATSVTTVLGSVRSLLQQFPALEGLVLASCAVALLLVIWLTVKVFRSRRRLGKTRKYDIITTPAEKVEMTPLNEDNDDDEDATVFDVKYSR
ncbi:membrane protein FAM174B [Hypanus sabinus]|uniref:membrane protein FAM174B n=1 Tax=Hypanus sabinus TaxID=79690 RepID=UPI0028C428F4|nr:membrane protein FAM174B [Hypanus sabinus]